MANDKLQELTDKLYNQGLSKGKEEGEKILASARAQAEKILADASAQAEKTLAQARKKADEINSKALSDVKMASFQALEATKADIMGAIRAKGSDKDVDANLSGEAFIKEIILSSCKALSAQTSCELEVVLPESTKASTADYVKKEIASAIGRGIDVTLSKKVKGGLNIAPKDGGYFISLSDETFKSLIREYLRPSTDKILFGE